MTSTSSVHPSHDATHQAPSPSAPAGLGVPVYLIGHDAEGVSFAMGPLRRRT
ncbi:hypothetical protein ACWD4T_29690 [Streptomyces umbrinus]